jgi:hypothetical protein
MDARGRLSINATKVAGEATDDGQFVVTTNDDTRDAEDIALGYTSMLLSEGCFRRMKTTGLQTRPINVMQPDEIAPALKQAQRLNAEGRTVLLDIHSNLEARRSRFDQGVGG